MAALFEVPAQRPCAGAALFEVAAQRRFAGAGIKDSPKAVVGEMITDGREKRRQLEQHSAEFQEHVERVTGFRE